jgi:hypothetical protein
MDFFEKPIEVYIKTNYLNEITDIGSSIFITDPYNWIKIDEGYGDRYSHAQNEYLPKPLVSFNGKYNYRYEYGQIVEN